jgi:carbamoyl-phosphate synthase large subunit
MKSTGEVLGLAKDFSEALLKGLIASGIKMDFDGSILISVSNGFKQEMIPIALGFARLGFNIYATSGTAHVLNEHFIAASVVKKISDGSEEIPDLIKSGKINFIICSPTKGRNPERDGFKIRRLAVESGTPCFTSLDTAGAVLNSLKLHKTEKDIEILALQDI